jgi:hypothetical protein
MPKDVYLVYFEPSERKSSQFDLFKFPNSTNIFLSKYIVVIHGRFV